MRTLKKTLSLVLVVAMVLGLCVVGASAYNKVEDFTDDVSKIGAAYYEAVGVLTGIGVIDGMTETAFEPQGTYTREQAAKIIAYMQLGKDKADSLKCTVAPFDDVAATRWSAGYIAYCVEQGIIDGMTETTFEPTGKLTGFQWAKMLLCAVGFGVKGEFTGSSWSVNTAKVAHTVDLFKGDLAGADHTAITREQAALYAFNVLTDVEKVAYSPNVTNYVFGIGGYEVVGGIGSTLGKDVFGLVPYTGIITANEGTGAKYTTLSKGYAGSALVANLDADTGIDMMYHAARIWAVNGVSVFVYDLAKTTTYSCTAINTAKAANASKVAGNTLTLGEVGVDYEYDLIDNSAYNKSYAGVTFKYNLAKLGVTTQSGVTYLYYTDNKADKTATIKAANLWTDISKINKDSSVVFLVEGGQYYIYATSAVTGTVKGIAYKTGAVTLTDGTVIERSILAAQAADTTIGKTYTFLLDNHGHYIGLTKQGVANLYFFTGEFQPTSAYNGYVGERTYSAQFINVTTGEVVDLPVLFSFIYDALTNDTTRFYDVGIAAANGLYYPDDITAAESIYANTYAIENDVKFQASTVKVSIDDGDDVDVILDNPTKFIIVTGKGSYVEKAEYNSLAEMLKAYPANSVTFDQVAMTVYTSSTWNTACSVVFGYLGSYTAEGTNLFLPKALDTNDYTKTLENGEYLYYYNDVFYLNGEPRNIVTNKAVSATEAGFYSYEITVDAHGNVVWNLTVQQEDAYVNLSKVGSGANIYLIDNLVVANSPVVVDLRAGAKGTPNEITDIATLYAQFRNTEITLAYTTNAAGNVDVIYILDAGWFRTISVGLSSTLKALGWKFVDADGKYVDSLTYVDDSAESIDAGVNLQVTLYNENLKAYSTNGTFVPTIKVDGGDAQDMSGVKLVNGALTFMVNVKGLDKSDRSVSYEIGGLVIGTVEVTAPEGMNVSPASKADVVLGQSMTVKLYNDEGAAFTDGSNTILNTSTWHGTVYVTRPVTGTLNADSTIITVEFYPLATNCVMSSDGFTPAGID